MTPELARAVGEAIARARAEARDETPATVAVAGFEPVAGGCIHRAGRVRLEDGRRFFLKSNAAVPADTFEREAEGLRALGAAGALRVPRVVATGAAGGGESFLVLEAIESGPRRRDFSERFGRGFAALHRAPTERGPGGEAFGFAHDNYLGSTPQPNGWLADWPEFFRRRRLGHQLELARRGGVSNARLDALGERLLGRLDELLGEPDEPAALLHGDLWGGNYLVDAGGEPVLIDPAAYYGRREADLAMTYLFGGFDERFYAAYEEAWPLAPGSAERLEVYKLYHYLNHLNLFGRSYLGGCLAILERFS